MEHRIGTTITLEVVEVKENTCTECVFKNMFNCPAEWKCGEHTRTDHKKIIYKLIKEE